MESTYRFRAVTHGNRHQHCGTRRRRVAPRTVFAFTITGAIACSSSSGDNTDNSTATVPSTTTTVDENAPGPSVIDTNGPGAPMIPMPVAPDPAPGDPTPDATEGGGGTTNGPPGGDNGPANGGSNMTPDGTDTGGSGGANNPGEVGGQANGTGDAGETGAPDGGATGEGGSSDTGSGGSGEATPSAGCGATPPESGRFSIDVNGTMREYILAVPDNYDPNKPYRLIFGWHPWGGSAQQVAGGGYYGLQNQANGEAIFVAGDGLPFQDSPGWANTNGQDIAFLEAMLDRFRSELCFDESRVFSTGFSFGGMMSFAVGCSGLARAIAPMAGNIQVAGCENGSQPVAVMGFHGDDDTVVGIDGGRAGRDAFIERNQCSEETAAPTSNWCDEVGDNNQPCTCVSYQNCAAGYPVTWCEFNGPHTPAPNSGATIWNFFSQF